MKPDIPTTEDFQELISYLPKLYRTSFKPIEHWKGGEKNDNGSITMPWPEYDPVVDEFFTLVSKECWYATSTSFEAILRLIEGNNTIETATLTQVKQMLTYCASGEKFNKGHWSTVIKKGYVARLIQRLDQLKNMSEEEQEQQS